MFAETLLESSPSSAPLLKKRHYFYATAAGVAASLIWFYALGRALSSSPVRAIALQSLLFGTIAVVFGMMLCYVYAESRRLTLNTVFWVALACLLNFAGFFCFLVYSAAKTGDWKRAAIPCAYAAEVLLVGAMALVPLIYTEALPKTFLKDMIETAPPPPPPPASSLGTQMRRAPHRVRVGDSLRVPTSIPPRVAIVRDEPLPPDQFQPNAFGVPGGIDNGLPGGVLGSLLGTIPQEAGPPPPSPPQRPKPVQQQQIRVSCGVIAAKLIYQPKPEYPELARLTRTEGAVVFEAVIGRDGAIEELKVLNGHPLLVKAAFEAVRQWRYQPTLLNGEPVEVLTEITVTFRLQ